MTKKEKTEPVFARDRRKVLQAQYRSLKAQIDALPNDGHEMGDAAFRVALTDELRDVKSQLAALPNDTYTIPV